jgi:hypothetical protein
MARKARMISAPAGGTRQLGQHTSMRLLAGSMGAPSQPMPGDEPLTNERFEAPAQDNTAWEQQVRMREMAEGIPEQARGDAEEERAALSERLKYTPLPAYDTLAHIKTIHSATDLSGLPGTFTLEVEQKPDGTWKVTAPGVHVGLFVADRDLGAALSRAPGVLAEIVRLDGVVARPKARRARHA